MIAAKHANKLTGKLDLGTATVALHPQIENRPQFKAKPCFNLKKPKMKHILLGPKAADQGVANAQFNLGFMYKRGQGVKQDSQEAAKWYRKAADQGLEVAQYNLGLMYDKGHGVKQDFKEAAKWDKKAADQRLAGANILKQASIATVVAVLVFGFCGSMVTWWRMLRASGKTTSPTYLCYGCCRRREKLARKTTWATFIKGVLPMYFCSVQCFRTCRLSCSRTCRVLPYTH